MAKGKFIPPELRWTIVRMHSAGMPLQLIETYTAVSERQINQIAAVFRDTGDIQEKPKAKSGKPAHLTGLEVEVSFIFTRRSALLFATNVLL